MHLLFQHCNYTLFCLVPYTLHHWQPVLGAEWQSYTLFELHVSDQPHWKRNEKMMLSDYLLMSLILHISLKDTGDSSMLKQNISKRNIFILHNEVFSSAAMCCILDIQLISYQLYENSLCIADKSHQQYFFQDLLACWKSGLSHTKHLGSQL